MACRGSRPPDKRGWWKALIRPGGCYDYYCDPFGLPGRALASFQRSSTPGRRAYIGLSGSRYSSASAWSWCPRPVRCGTVRVPELVILMQRARASRIRTAAKKCDTPTCALRVRGAQNQPDGFATGVHRRKTYAVEARNLIAGCSDETRIRQHVHLRNWLSLCPTEAHAGENRRLRSRIEVAVWQATRLSYSLPISNLVEDLRISCSIGNSALNPHPDTLRR